MTTPVTWGSTTVTVQQFLSDVFSYEAGMTYWTLLICVLYIAFFRVASALALKCVLFCCCCWFGCFCSRGCCDVAVVASRRPAKAMIPTFTLRRACPHSNTHTITQQVPKLPAPLSFSQHSRRDREREFFSPSKRKQQGGFWFCEARAHSLARIFISFFSLAAGGGSNSWG